MTSTPHDALFKQVFARPELAAQELRHALPQRVVERVDWDTLRLAGGEFVDPSLHALRTDLLFSAKLKEHDERMLFYVLLEHQSSDEPHMALRLLEYMVGLWSRHVAKHPAAPLPWVIPVVLSHARGGWRAPTRFEELFSEQVRALGAKHVPHFEYEVDDLQACSADELRARAASDLVNATLWLLRDARDTSALLAQMVLWVQVLERLAKVAGRDLRVLFMYLLEVSDVTVPQLRGILRAAPKAEGVIMTGAERLLAEGEARGLIEGKVEGRVEGKAEAILMILDARGIATSAENRARIESCDDLETLETWLVRAVTATDAAAVFES